MKRYWPFIVFFVFVAGFTLGLYMAEKVTRQTVRAEYASTLTALAAENWDVNTRLAQAELMIAVQAKAIRPSTQD